MQYQKNIKLDKSESSNIYKENSNSNTGEMAYMDPIGNQQIISTISIVGGERSIDLTEKSKHRPIIQSVKNDIKTKTNLHNLVEENQIPSIIINMPNDDNIDYIKERRSRDLNINLRKSKGENIYNIKTMNQKISPKNNIKNIYQTSTNPQFYDTHNFNNSSNDSASGRYNQIIFDSRTNNISRSPQFFRRERGGLIPLNNMSPNLNNYEDNSYEQKNEINNNYYYNNRNIITTNSQRNISAEAPLRYERQLNINNNNNNNIINQNKIKYLNKNDIIDEINFKYKNKNNQNISNIDVKKIMKKFTNIYNPLKNKNGILVESSQVILPGASDDVFSNRYKVLSRMNKLSNILLSKKKRSSNKYKENTNLNKRSISRTKSQSPLSIKSFDRSKSNSPLSKNIPNNKFLYVSLAMISSKGPNAEDRIILRKMRLDKGGVVDLAQEERKKTKYKIKKITKNKNNINFYHTNPKYREIAAKIIQSWWKELKRIYDKKLKKIILIQSIFRGKWVRKNMYDLLYLNYLYICFCRKIEKILSNHVRPYVFDKLFSYKIAEINLLKKILNKKEKRDNLSLLSFYIHKWRSIIKDQNTKNKLGKQLIDIRKQNENKLNILLAFFNKWRYMTKISNIPQGKNFNIYPLHKINGLCKIMDAAKKYIQKKAIKKIIKQLINYLLNQLRENLLKKIISKKSEYTKNLLRNILYLWYSKILNFKKISNDEEAEKLREIRQKILKIILLNFEKHLNQRLLRKYFIRLYLNNNPENINKYVLYEILRKLDVEDLKKNKENIIDIKGKKYILIKNKKNLKIIKLDDENHSSEEEEKENEQIVDNYEDIINKINKRKSGEYKEGEDIPEDIKKDLDKIDNKNKRESIKKKHEKILISEKEKKYIIKKKKRNTKEKSNRDSDQSEEENEISNEEMEYKRKNSKPKKVSKPKNKYIETEIKKRKSQGKYDDNLTPISSIEQEEEEDSSQIKEKIIYIKKKRDSQINEKRDKPYKYIIKKRKSSPQRTRLIKIKKIKEEKTSSRSQSEEYEEIEDSLEEEKPKNKRKFRRYSEPIKNRKFYPKKNIYNDNESEESLDDYNNKKNIKHIYIDENPKKKRQSYKKIIEEVYSSDEESPEERKKRKSKYIYIKKDRDGNKYIKEEISSPSSEEEYKKKIRRKTQEYPYMKKRKSDIQYNKIEEEEENEDKEYEDENKTKKKKSNKKSLIDKSDVYNKKHYKKNNLKNDINEDDENMKDKNRKSKVIYNKEGRYILDSDKDQSDIDLYDKNGNRIKDIKKHINKSDELDIPMYDEDKREIKDIKKYINKDGDINIDIYDKNGKYIKNINKYKDEKGNINKNIYDKNGNRLLDLKKYIKGKQKNRFKEKEFYDKNGNKINNLEQYRNKEGDITIPIYNKKGNRILDLDKDQNKLDIYDKNRKKINNLKKYKNENGEYNIDLFDEDGNKIIDLKKYKKEEKEKILKRHSEIIRYKTKEGEYSTDIYDKNGKKITDLSEYKNEDGQYTIPIYDKHRNSILSLERKSPKKKEYEKINITRYNINPKDENKNLNLLTKQGEEYIPYYNKKNDNSKSNIKPINLIGGKTELNKLVEKYNFLRKDNFSLKNLSESDKNKLINFDPKKALLLDLLNDKEQKLKIYLWKYFCIWRSNAIKKYNDLGDILKFIKGESLNNLKGDFIETLKTLKNPRLYSIALKKIMMHLFHKNIDLLRDAFNRWKKIIYKDNINSLKSKFFFSLCKKNDKNMNEKDDGVSTEINNIDNLRKKKKINLSGPYPYEVKNILSLYFHKWKGDYGLTAKKFFYKDRTLSLPDDCKKYIFKKDKISENFINALLSNIPDKNKEDELNKFVQHPLRRMIVLRYRKERINMYKVLLRWYNKVRLATKNLDRLVQGREKLTKLMKYKPSKIFLKRMKLMNPNFYKAKGEKLVQILFNIILFNPFKKFINNMILFNRVNQLNKILPEIDEKISKYFLKKYFQKWKKITEELKEQKIKLLLTYVKKKIKDEKKINNQRKNELLKRIILNLEKNKLNKLLLSFKVWYQITKVIKEQNSLVREKEGKLLTIIKGQEKIIDGNYIKKGGEINIKFKKNEQGEFTIDNIINKNLTEEERQEIIKKKIPKMIYLIDDKIKSLLQIKLYKWKNITNKIICDKNARIIQRFIRIKLGNKLWKKRINFFSNLAKKFFAKIFGVIGKINRLNNILKKILLNKILNNLRKNEKNTNCLISLNENITKASDEIINRNKTIVMKQIIKLYTYKTLEKLFENLKNMQRYKLKIIFQHFINKLKDIKLKKSEYNYEKQISKEAMPYRKKLSFSKKQSSSNVPKKDLDKSIPYISLLPHLTKFLEDKIQERKNYSMNKLKQNNKSKKLYSLFTKYINKKLVPDKDYFYKQFIKLATNGEKQKDLYELLRKYLIKKKLFIAVGHLSRFLKLFYLIKLTIVNKDITDKRFLRILIRKWRFLSFSRVVSKKKMSILYKNFHINYLEMVNDVFGEEKNENPSVIKEFERFGANVGMWENEHPDFVEESKYCQNVRKNFKFYRPKEWDNKNKQIKVEEEKEIKEGNEIKETKKDKIKKYEEKKDNNQILKEKKEEPKEKKRYFRRNFKQNK